MTLKISSIIFVTFLLFSACASFPSYEQHQQDETPATNQNQTPIQDDALLMIAAMDVGQGDSTLIVTPSQKVILIDSGPVESGAQAILPLFKNLGITHLDYVFISHYDADHLGGMSEVLAGYDGKKETEDDFLPLKIFDGGGAPPDAGTVFYDYLDAILPYRNLLMPGDSLDLEDGLTIQCIYMNEKRMDGAIFPLPPREDNGRAMALLFSYNSFRYFTAGDLTGGGPSGNQTTPDVENFIAPLIGDVDVLHVNHHGSQTSSSEKFLETLLPEAALIQAGNKNTYGHPHQAVIERFLKIGSEIYQTGGVNTPSSPKIHLLNNSIFIFVSEDGSYTVNGDPY